MNKNIRTFNGAETERLHELDGIELASFFDRLIAFYIDFFATVLLFLIIVIGGLKILTVIGITDPNKDIKFEFDFHNWYSIIFIVVYFGLFTYWGNGKTPGKRLRRIRVVSLTHERITFWQSFERALGYGASALEFFFGFLQFFINPNRRTVHDRIAETIVIKERKGKGQSA